jgi:predicted transglutaminase-like cysteine proteinase
VAIHTDTFVEQGILKIKKNIENGVPVIISVTAGFSENKEDHMVLVVGEDKGDFLLLDPILSSDQNPMKASVEYMKKFWKKFAIFVE